jgi:hypothetical protein
VTSGKTMSFSGAVTVFGVGLTAQTSYNADHEQHLSACSGAARKHWTWGKNGPFTDHPGVIYSW